MRMIYRVLYPACASFGPMFMVLGLEGRGTTYGFVWARAGALMTSAALLMLFGRCADETRTITPRERRNQLLFWCAMTVIGVLIWLLAEWVASLP